MEHQVAAAIRADRVERGLRQADVARMAGVSAATVSRLEAGRVDVATIAAARPVAAVLGIRLELVARRRGGELDRLINARRSAMHELLARCLAAVPGWERAAEVSHSIYGERGVIDVSAGTPHEPCSSWSS